MSRISGRNRAPALLLSAACAGLLAVSFGPAALAAPPSIGLIAPEGYDGDAGRVEADRDSLDADRGRPRIQSGPQPQWMKPSATTKRLNRQVESRLIESRLREETAAANESVVSEPQSIPQRPVQPPGTVPFPISAGTESLKPRVAVSNAPPGSGPVGRAVPAPRVISAPATAEPVPSAPVTVMNEPRNVPQGSGSGGIIEKSRQIIEREFDSAVRGVPPAIPDTPDDDEENGPIPPALEQVAQGPPPAPADPAGVAPQEMLGANIAPLVDPASDGLVYAPPAARRRVKQALPSGLLYKSYLAGEKESRFALQVLNETGRGNIWEVALGGRVGIYRNGTEGPINPEGFQLDMEGAVFPRLDQDSAQDVDAMDFRFGIPLTWREGPLAYKFGYYHLSSHLGDEYMVKHPGVERVNYVRDAILFGTAYDLTRDSRVYGEVAWAWHHSGGARPLEFQFGAEYSPARAGRSMFAAANVHTRQNKSWDNSINIEAGWQWRGEESQHLFRVGGQYYNGKSMQYEFFDKSEQLVGIGMWFDY